MATEREVQTLVFWDPKRVEVTFTDGEAQSLEGNLWDASEWARDAQLDLTDVTDRAVRWRRAPKPADASGTEA